MEHVSRRAHISYPPALPAAIPRYEIRGHLCARFLSCATHPPPKCLPSFDATENICCLFAWECIVCLLSYPLTTSQSRPDTRALLFLPREFAINRLVLKENRCIIVSFFPCLTRSFFFADSVLRIVPVEFTMQRCMTSSDAASSLILCSCRVLYVINMTRYQIPVPASESGWGVLRRADAAARSILFAGNKEFQRNRRRMEGERVRVAALVCFL